MKEKKKTVGHIICMNDATKAICLGTVEEAEKLKDEYRERYKKISGVNDDRVDALYYWHVHENVEVVDGEGKPV